MRIIFASHGNLAKAMIDSVQMIAGDITGIEAIGLFADEGFDDFKEKLESMIRNARSEELLVLTDLFFGSPFNAATQLMGRYHFAHITGINLPALLEIALSKNSSASVWELKAHVMKSAKESLIDVNERSRRWVTNEKRSPCAHR